MDKAVSLAIHSTMQTQGWLEIRALLEETFLEARKPSKRKLEGKSAEAIALEVTAECLSAQAVEKFLKKLDLIRGPQETVDRDYR